MIDIFVGPTDWGGGFIVVTNVAHQLARQILYRSEDASGNNVTLNLREPNCDLVKPAGVGRGIVDPNRGVSLKKFKDFLGLMRTQIVGNYVDLTTCRLAIQYLSQKIDKLRAGAPV
jgi:hypothetical protein